MKRFYKAAAAVAEEGGFAIRLDGRGVRTPARAPLLLPSERLAQAIAAEWDAQGETIEPRSMRLTGLANAAIDQVAPNRATFLATLSPYAETDLLCYRADDPPELVTRQTAAWDPLLAWARGRYDVHFELVAGIIHRAQPPATIARLVDALEAHDAFALAGLSPLITIGGSLVTALALVEGAVNVNAAFTATHLDELWQAEQWGEDILAKEARDVRFADFEAAARFIELR